MTKQIFTPRFLMTIAVIFGLSSFATFTFTQGSKQATMAATGVFTGKGGNSIVSAPASEEDIDRAIDTALGYSLNGNHAAAIDILFPLAEQGVTRAKLYLATAYYHGNGVQKDRQRAKALFFELQKEDYETHIVNTYLSLLGFQE